jgi:hypothetical protein
VKSSVVVAVLKNLVHCALFVMATLMLATVGPG